MNSNEEYLENLLQSMMDGKVAGPSKNDTSDPGRQKSAIEMLTGEEPEQALFAEVQDSDGGLEADEGEAVSVPLGTNLGMEESSMASTDLDHAEADAFGMEEAGLAESGLDGIDAEGVALDESILNDMGVEEPPLDMNLEESDMDLGDIALEDMNLDDSIEDIGLGDLGMDDIALEEHSPEDMEEPILDDMNLEDTDMDLGSIGLEDMDLNDGMEDIGLGDLGIDDIALEEHGLDDMLVEEPALDDIDLSDGTEDIELSELGMDDIALEEHGLDDMALGEADLGDMGLEETPEEELLLGNMSDETPEGDDMALEESDFDGMSEDFTLEENGMDDLAEINNLLEQSGQDEEIDDEMLALLESVSDSGEDDMMGEKNNEFSFFPGDDGGDNGMASIEGLNAEEAPPEEEGKKKKGRKWKRKDKKAAKNAAEITDNSAETGDIDGTESKEGANAEKKPGAFARFLAFLTETDEDDEENAEGALQTGEASDENSELLAELSAEDKKQGKKEKKKKEKKGKEKKAKKASGGDEGGEDEGTAKKKKKPKKEKKVKEIDEEALKEEPGKKLSKKKVIPVILFCATIMLCIIVFTIIIPDHMQKRDARIAYDMGNYEDVYDLLYGKDLNEEEEVLLHKSTIIMKMERKLESYQNNLRMGDRELEALNALVQGVALYFELLPEADEYSVMGELEEKYQQILVILSDQYGLSELDVMNIIYSEDDTIYTQKIMSVLYGVSYLREEEQSNGVLDVLPEEQEILDGLPEETMDNITGDILNGSNDNTLDDMSGEASNEIPEETQDNNGSEETPGNAAEGAAASDGEAKYIEPVSVEVHQNN